MCVCVCVCVNVSLYVCVCLSVRLYVCLSECVDDRVSVYTQGFWSKLHVLAINDLFVRKF